MGGRKPPKIPPRPIPSHSLPPTPRLVECSRNSSAGTRAFEPSDPGVSSAHTVLCSPPVFTVVFHPIPFPSPPAGASGASSYTRKRLSPLSLPSLALSFNSLYSFCFFTLPPQLLISSPHTCSCAPELIRWQPAQQGLSLVRFQLNVSTFCVLQAPAFRLDVSTFRGLFREFDRQKCLRLS